MLEELSNDPEKFEYYQSRHRIQMAELSVEVENRQIREDYAKAVEENRDLKITLAKTLLEANKMTIEQIAETAKISV